MAIITTVKRCGTAIVGSHLKIWVINVNQQVKSCFADILKSLPVYKCCVAMRTELVIQRFQIVIESERFVIFGRCSTETRIFDKGNNNLSSSKKLPKAAKAVRPRRLFDAIVNCSHQLKARIILRCRMGLIAGVSFLNRSVLLVPW